MSLQPFAHEGIKAWLTACGPALDDLPATLTALVARFGDLRCDPRFEVELHAVSLAKRAGRRIARRRDLPVSIAESLDTDCSVRETELVVEQPDGTMRFASYGPEGQREDHGYFPAGPGVDLVKMTPDACMGCHYRFDTRTFTVRAPSGVALGLQLRRTDGTPNWTDGGSCASPGEILVRPSNEP